MIAGITKQLRASSVYLNSRNMSTRTCNFPLEQTIGMGFSPNVDVSRNHENPIVKCLDGYGVQKRVASLWGIMMPFENSGKFPIE